MKRVRAWIRAHPSVATVLGIYVTWTILAAISSEALPLGRHLWRGEGSAVELLELALLVGYIGAWIWIAGRLRRPGARSVPWMLAAGMVAQLVVLLGEELDWGGAVAPYRNLRQATHEVLPQVLDTPIAAAYLLAFLLSPLVPLSRVRSFLERAVPARATRDDAWATVIGPPCSLLIYPLVGDPELGELHQLGIYAVLGLITVRIARAVGGTR